VPTKYTVYSIDNAYLFNKIEFFSSEVTMDVLNRCFLGQHIKPLKTKYINYQIWVTTLLMSVLFHYSNLSSSMMMPKSFLMVPSYMFLFCFLGRTKSHSTFICNSQWLFFTTSPWTKVVACHVYQNMACSLWFGSVLWYCTLLLLLLRMNILCLLCYLVL